MSPHSRVKLSSSLEVRRDSRPKDTYFLMHNYFQPLAASDFLANNLQGTAGLGLASLHALAYHNPSHIYFSGRNVERANSIIEEVKGLIPSIQVTFVEMDLSSLESISTALSAFTHGRLDILMCNAGLMALPPELSKDGYEMQFAVNHLGHAMLVKNLLPSMLRTAAQPGSDVRVIILSSIVWRGHPKGGIQFEGLKTVQDLGPGGPWLRYGQSKLANLLYASELARRYPSITTVSVHPGIVDTGLVNGLNRANRLLIFASNAGKVLKTDQGVLNQVWAAAGARKSQLVNGAYYMPIGVMSNGKLKGAAISQELKRKLWNWTEKQLRGW